MDYAKPILRILLYLTIIVVNLCAGTCLLFFQFTDYSLRVYLELLLPPLVVLIHTSTIGSIVRKTRQLPQMRKKLLWLIGGPMLPSLVSGTAAIACFLVGWPGIILGTGCGSLVHETVSPDETKIARFYSGLGPAGFGACNYVYVYYEDFPAVRRDVYKSGESIAFDAENPISWEDDKTIVLSWDNVVIDLRESPGNLPLWLSILPMIHYLVLDLRAA